MKKIIPYLTKATASNGYKLLLVFEDGISGIIDLSIWKEKEGFAIWKDEKFFSSFKITADKKIEWNEEIDMDPDAFYLKLTNKTFEEYAGSKQLLRDTQ